MMWSKLTENLSVESRTLEESLLWDISCPAKLFVTQFEAGNLISALSIQLILPLRTMQLLTTAPDCQSFYLYVNFCHTYAKEQLSRTAACEFMVFFLFFFFTAAGNDISTVIWLVTPEPSQHWGVLYVKLSSAEVLSKETSYRKLL